MKKTLIVLAIALAACGCCGAVGLTPGDAQAVNEQARGGLNLMKQCQNGDHGACIQAGANLQAIADKTANFQ